MGPNVQGRAFRWTSIATLALAVCLGTSLGPARRAAGAVAASPPQRQAPSIKDSPGYYPPADPESTSERIGRRLNAPLVSKPFRGGAASLDDLGRSICRAIHRG